MMQSEKRKKILHENQMREQHQIEHLMDLANRVLEAGELPELAQENNQNFVEALQDNGIVIGDLNEESGAKVTINAPNEDTVHIVRPLYGINIPLEENENQEQMQNHFISDYEHEEELDDDQKKTLDTWWKRTGDITQTTEDLIQYKNELQRLYNEGRLTAEQVYNRIEVIQRVHRALDGNPEHLQEGLRGFWTSYDEAREGLENLKEEVSEESERYSVRNHLSYLNRDGGILAEEREHRTMDMNKKGEVVWGAYQDARERVEDSEEYANEEQQRQYNIRKHYFLEAQEGPVNMEEVEEHLRNQTEQLNCADRWLLSSCMSKKNAFEENTTVFSLLKRPEAERMFAYYLIEMGCPKKLSDSEAILFRRKNYVPDMKKISKTDVGKLDLGRLYQQICNAGALMEHMDMISEALDNLKEDIEERLETRQAYLRAHLHEELRERLGVDAQEEQAEELQEQTEEQAEELQEQTEEQAEELQEQTEEQAEEQTEELQEQTEEQAEELQEQTEEQAEEQQVQHNWKVVDLGEIMARQQAIEIDESEEEQEEEHDQKYYEQREMLEAEKILTMINDVTVALDDLEKVKADYDNANFFRKLQQKSKVKAAVKNLYDRTEELLDAKIHIPGSGDISNVMNFIKDTLMAGNTAKTVGITTSAGFKAAAQTSLEKGMLDAAVGNASVAKGTAIGSHALGAALGCVNLVLAVAGILKSYRTFANLTKVGQVGLVLDWVNQSSSSVSSVLSSVSGAVNAGLANTASQIGAAATAGVGILVGGFSTGVGAYKFGTNIRGDLQAKEGYEKLRKERGVTDEQESLLEARRKQKMVLNQDMDQFVLGSENIYGEINTEFLFEKNIFKIRERISRRNKISAGCQVAGGVCAMAASTCLILGQGVAAAAIGVAGLAFAAGGLIVTQKMKSAEYEKVVDEFLELDRMAEIRYAERKEKTNKAPGWLEKRRIKKRLRQEMLEMYGFSSVKAFYVDVMKRYALHIYDKIRFGSEAEDAENKDAKDKDTEAFLSLVESLGLKYEIRDEEDGSVKVMPTAQMIFAKLMG